MDYSHYEFTFKKEKLYWWHRVRREIVVPLCTGSLLDVGCGCGSLLTEIPQSSGFDISPSQYPFVNNEVSITSNWARLMQYHILINHSIPLHVSMCLNISKTTVRELTTFAAFSRKVAERLLWCPLIGSCGA